MKTQYFHKIRFQTRG